MRSPGRVFSKEQIYDIIWNEPYSGDYNVVMRHICNIREKIEDDPGQPMYIQTVRGVGYRFNGNLGSEWNRCLLLWFYKEGSLLWEDLCISGASCLRYLDRFCCINSNSFISCLKETYWVLRSVNRYILEEFSQGNSGWYKNTSAEIVTEEILSSGIGKKYLDTIIKRLAGLYTNREDIVNRFALLSGIVGRFRRAFVQMMKQ